MTLAIHVKGLSKSFTVKHKKTGLLESMKSLVHPTLSEQTLSTPLTFKLIKAKY
ncbi:hypothetical protein [Laceyella putida]|uniref:ABC transporter ATP-binding protein n=1 Tax=Laceyella putida TaxID=110101 RepID=A0ABW2RIV9_9BACL